MTIPAQRFSFLDQETNVAVSDFLEATNQGTLNAPGEDLAQIATEDLMDFLGNYNTADGVASPDKPPGRIDVNSLLSVIDPNGLTTKERDAAIKNASAIGTGTPLTGMFGQLTDNVKNDIIGQRNGGFSPPFRMQVDGAEINGKDDYDVTAIGKALNKITNGAYDFTSMDIGATVDTIVGITTAATKGGMPAVFSTLLDQMSIADQDVISKSLYSIIGGFIADNDTVGLLAMVTQLNNVSMKLLMPDVATNAANSLTVPRDIRERELSAFNASVKDALDSFDSSFGSSSFDGIRSTNGVRNQALANSSNARGSQLRFGPAIGDLQTVNADPNLVEHFFVDPFDNTRKSTYIDKNIRTGGTSTWNLMLKDSGQLPVQEVTKGSGFGPPRSSTAVGNGFGPPAPSVARDRSDGFGPPAPTGRVAAVTQSLGLF